MGVQGWNWLLAQQGWLPLKAAKTSASANANARANDAGEATTSLWMQDSPATTTSSSATTTFRDRLVTIPPQSELYLDGLCLCFHVHQVAYARYLRDTTSTTSTTTSTTSTTTANTTHLLPGFMPLELLTQVTREFVDALLQPSLQMKLIVYWDGDQRYSPPDTCDSDQEAEADDTNSPDLCKQQQQQQEENDCDSKESDSEDEDDTVLFFKQDTELQRQSKRMDEWSHLMEFCLDGRLPFSTKTTTSTKSVPSQLWEQHFPKSRLFITQVMHALTQIMLSNKHLSMHFCQEEADAVMARAVTGRDTAFVVGLDSDFCFFPHANYIPITTLHLHHVHSVSSGDNNNTATTNTNTNTTSPVSLKAIVMRRDLLAQSLNLPESAMVELAIIMGNDYVRQDILHDIDNGHIVLPTTTPNDNQNHTPNNKAVQEWKRRLGQANHFLRAQAYMDFLRHQGPGYQLPMMHLPRHVQHSLQFVRDLYNLHDMSHYPCLESDEASSSLIVPSVILKDLSFMNNLKQATAVDPMQNKIQPNDQDSMSRLVKDTVATYLRDIVRILKQEQVQLNNNTAKNNNNNNNNNNNSDDCGQDQSRPAPFLTKSHIDAFLLLSQERPPYSVIDQEIMSLHQNQNQNQQQQQQSWRPLWGDIGAVYWIESIISKIVRNSLEQLVTSNDGVIHNNRMLVDSPGALFCPYLYHAMLRIARDKHFLEHAPVDEQDLQSPEMPPAADAPKLVLPVDEFEDEILESVRKNRVTIIQGETGCGKSSRIPIMLLNAPPPDPMQKQTKLFISQPRRIAAKALVERLRDVEPELKDQIALRMGFGVREYENDKTRAWFVTTGYLVRLLANHPERFENISFLIVDEVHERSVDTDILCLLCRRLLNTNRHIRLVLMSATLAAALYQSYFDVPEPPIKVGARRFPVKEIFLDDLKKQVALTPKDAKNVTTLMNECLAMKCKRPPSVKYMEAAYSLVSKLATVVANPGSSVLIFVPGMNDILAISELIEAVTVPGITFTCVPIHSDIPFEDQMLVFDASRSDEIKVVIATNSAESSITLPEVDNVICLGLCKQIVYNESSHRQMLMPTWISRASATQRAGRTGRVRPGFVYRIYARVNYESHMEAFEPGEMLRIPLDSVILMLKEMLSEEKVSEVLQSSLEPPDIKTIYRSFESLFRSHFISSPDDDCQLTNLGSFVSCLGIDLALGSLIGLGIQMGVGAEAIQMAAILSFPKAPWLMSNPLIHPTENFNEITVKTYVSRCHFDANLFSEPLSMMNLVWDYEHLDRKDLLKWCNFYAIFLPRMKRLAATTQNLRKRVADFLGLQEDLLKVARPPTKMTPGMVRILQILQVWVFHKSLIQFDTKGQQKKISNDGYHLELESKSDQLEPKHLEQILMKDRHPYTLKSSSEIRQKGTFVYLSPGSSKKTVKDDFMDRMESCLLSFATEKAFDVAWILYTNLLVIYSVNESAAGFDLLEWLQNHRKENDNSILVATPYEGKSRRGIAERACGMWTVKQVAHAPLANDAAVVWTRRRFGPFERNQKKLKKTLQDIKNALEKSCRASDYRVVALNFPWDNDSISFDTSTRFEMVSLGAGNPVNNIDMHDLLGPHVQSVTKQKTGKQKVQFPLAESTPYIFHKNGKSPLTTTPDNDSDNTVLSWNRPLIHCIPEAARLWTVLASSRRREHCIRVKEATIKDGKKEKTSSKRAINDDCPELTIYLDSSTKLANRWKRFNTNDSVFVNDNSVPATAIPVNAGSSILYCVCANTLEVRGGALKAEGLTLLPPGRAFLLLSRFAFGLYTQYDIDEESMCQKAAAWVDPKINGRHLKDLKGRIEKAMEFHSGAMDLGETLECFPEKIAELLDIFDGLDGMEAKVWESLPSNPLIDHNLTIHRKSLEQQKTVRYLRRESSGVDAVESKTLPSTNNSARQKMASEQKMARLHKRESSGVDIVKGSGMPSSSVDVRAAEPATSAHLSPVHLSDAQVQKSMLMFRGDPTTTSSTKNILDSIGACSTLAQVVCRRRLVVQATGNISQEDTTLNSSEWQVFETKSTFENKRWYLAIFTPLDIPYTPPRKRRTEPWMKETHIGKARPHTESDAVACIPSKSIGKTICKQQHMRVLLEGVPSSSSSSSSSKSLVFDSLELALEMECAFWLERQFGAKNLRWHERQGGISELVTVLNQSVPAPGPAVVAKKKRTRRKRQKKPNSK